ncbi:MAG TPA: glycosyltransferase [Chloroflexota bacterium]|nr:glycosyltransferase [Chloroflexota bacterium]
MSLVATVRDELATIDALLASVGAQTRPPDEVVIADGGSRDGTRERLAEWSDRLPIKVVDAPGSTIARGRNLAIRAARGDLIAVTDAGVRLEPTWLAALLARRAPDVDVVSGFFSPDPRSVFERALGATVLPVLADVSPARFLPSSRSVLFRRVAWECVGGYPEWLDYGEDLVFDLALRRAGCRFAFAPDALVWFRPRGSLRSFFRQYFQYARGDGKADLWRGRHAVRYATYITACILLAGGRRQLLGRLVVLGLGGLAYTRRPYQRLAPQLRAMSAGNAIYAVGLVPVIRLVGDVAKMLGYPVGVWWRISRSSS